MDIVSLVQYTPPTTQQPIDATALLVSPSSVAVVSLKVVLTTKCSTQLLKLVDVELDLFSKLMANVEFVLLIQSTMLLLEDARIVKLAKSFKVANASANPV